MGQKYMIMMKRSPWTSSSTINIKGIVYGRGKHLILVFVLDAKFLPHIDASCLIDDRVRVDLAHDICDFVEVAYSTTNLYNP